MDDYQRFCTNTIAKLDDAGEVMPGTERTDIKEQSLPGWLDNGYVVLEKRDADGTVIEKDGAEVTS